MSLENKGEKQFKSDIIFDEADGDPRIAATRRAQSQFDRERTLDLKPSGGPVVFSEQQLEQNRPENKNFQVAKAIGPSLDGMDINSVMELHSTEDPMAFGLTSNEWMEIPGASAGRVMTRNDNSTV